MPTFNAATRVFTSVVLTGMRRAHAAARRFSEAHPDVSCRVGFVADDAFEGAFPHDLPRIVFTVDGCTLPGEDSVVVCLGSTEGTMLRALESLRPDLEACAAPTGGRCAR